MAVVDRLDSAIIDAESEITQLNNKLRTLDSMLPSQRQGLEADIEKSLADLDTRLNKMTNDLKAVQPNQRDYYRNEVEGLRTQYNQISNELRTKRQAAANNPNVRQAEQVYGNQKRSQAITDNLDEAIRVGNDTITTGNVTMATLIDDRQRLEHISSNLDVIDDEAATGLARARRMVRRACFNGFVAWIIVIVLLALMGAEIWWKASRKSTKSE
jgi:vesicle transport through interaction with t-SNAREs protein 1